MSEDVSSTEHDDELDGDGLDGDEPDGVALADQCADARKLLSAAADAAGAQLKEDRKALAKAQAAHKKSKPPADAMGNCWTKLHNTPDPLGKLTEAKNLVQNESSRLSQIEQGHAHDITNAQSSIVMATRRQESMKAAVTALTPPVVKATGAKAGKPGTWTPAGSTPPADLAALKAAKPPIAADPKTAWKQDEHVLTGDGKPAHWYATTWAAGKGKTPLEFDGDITPKEGSIKGGTEVKVKGKGFAAGATVKFGKVKATAVVVDSATQISCKTPAHAKGAVEVLVEIGDEGAGKDKAYTYIEP